MKPEKKIFTISELNKGVRSILEKSFPMIWVEGEISNLACPASGHIYFSLKDSKAQVSCAMFKGRKQLLRFSPENGMKVLMRTRVSLYEPRGNFQLIAEHMEAAGDGALLRAFEELKARLAQEGLFDEHIKQAIPELPKRIGVITSATGAAVRDVLSVLQRRFPAIPVLLYPVPVQGNQAAPAIVNTLKLANQRKDCDVLLLVRGGGSLEDLWAFNEEVVARAIQQSDIPLVSGIGHEVDYTIADFVADQRAATPSAAAELVSPDQETYLGQFIYFEQRLSQLILEKIKQQKQQLGWLKSRLNMQHPVSYLQQQSQRLDDLQQRLHTAWQYTLREQQHRIEQLRARLLTCSPASKIELGQHQLTELRHRLKQSILFMLNNKQQKLAHLSHTLHAISPLQTLSRGYSIVYNSKHESITQSEQVKLGDAINTQFFTGSIHSTVTKINK